MRAPIRARHVEESSAATIIEAADFQSLMADVTERLADAEPAWLDAVITHGMREIAQALPFDRLRVWRWRGGDALAVCTHSSVTSFGDGPPETLPLASSPHVFSRLHAGDMVLFSSTEDLFGPVDRAVFHALAVRSAVLVPLTGRDAGTFRMLCASSVTNEPAWDPLVVLRVRLVAGVLSQAIARRDSEVALAEALRDLRQLRTGTSEPPPDSRRDMPVTAPVGLIVYESPAVRAAVIQIQQVAPTPATVLLRGETGAGKEVFAQAIHNLSPRRRRPMVVVNCAAIPAALIESELFGRERGAYTGALSRQLGRFEMAHQSTLFLDEIGDLPTEIQVKLLRVLQERTLERLGSTQSIKIDVRIIAATHRDLEKAVREGTFREDLFYRLNVFPIVVPPLRERIEDIPGLAWSFVDEFARSFGKTITSIEPASLRALQQDSWPGNVRELRNVIERAMILATGEQLTIAAPRSSGGSVRRTSETLAALEHDHIRAVLESSHWRVRGRGGAAVRLGLKPTTLESRIARLGITRPSPSASH